MNVSGKTALVLGGARSGKSRFAEDLVGKSGLQRCYLATGRAYDQEMEERIARHREDRGGAWLTCEEPVDLTGGLRRLDGGGRFILVDCLTLWLTNLMMEGADIAAHGDSLVAALDGLSAKVIFVSNEVGLGIVPDNKMAREFRDHAGRLHQRLAAAVDEVFFVAAGLPLRMKG